MRKSRPKTVYYFGVKIHGTDNWDVLGFLSLRTARQFKKFITEHMDRVPYGKGDQLTAGEKESRRFWEHQYWNGTYVCNSNDPILKIEIDPQDCPGWIKEFNREIFWKMLGNLIEWRGPRLPDGWALDHPKYGGGRVFRKCNGQFDYSFNFNIIPKKVKAHRKSKAA